MQVSCQQFIINNICMEKFRLIFTLLLITTILSTPLTKLDLSNWEFKVIGRFDDKWFKAHVPSNIYLDLLDNRLIEDPFFRDNQDKSTWIHSATVVYRTVFNISQKLKTVKIHELVFQGLDTYASINLNGKIIETTNNSYVKYVIPVKSFNMLGENTLEITFIPSTKIDAEEQNKFRLPFAYGYTRKAPYQYGWDWAPTLLSVGIWKPAYILGYDLSRIDYVWFRNKIINSQQAVINVAVVLQHEQNINPMVERPCEISIKLQGKEIGRMRIKEKIGYKDIAIPSPKLWWPRNVGTPHLYNFTLQLVVDKQLIESRYHLHGIRTIQLNTTEGAFQFIVNGYPVYAKGGNYVPPDMFQPRFDNPYFKPPYTLQQYMETIEESNYNMIRVWGGGQYQSQQFYQECSKRGIMVFQDFMFSVNVYPGTENFLRNCEQEVKQQIRRIRNHAALALWSGNNQILQGVYSWGWGSPQYRKNYELLFEKLIRKILQIESPDISYIPSSPVFGSGGDVSKGDIHSWSVWAGGAPFESYENTVARFNSQFGTQAFPVWETVKSFSSDNERSYSSTIMLKHQKHNSQFGTLQRYINDRMHKSKDFQMEVFQSGLVQAFGVGLAIAAQRSERPHCWGTLYWQFNDAWPGISWASMDYYGRWKPLQYAAKRLYSDIAIFIANKNNQQVKVRIVNDRLFKTQIVYKVLVMNFNGKILFNKTENITIEANQVVNPINFKNSERPNLLNSETENNVVIYGQVIAPKQSVMRNTYFFKNPKELNLPLATLTISYNIAENSITLSADVFVKNVYISHSNNYIKLSDNYFDMLPSVDYKVTLSGGQLNQLKDGLIYRSYRESYSTQAMKIVLK